MKSIVEIQQELSRELAKIHATNRGYQSISYNRCIAIARENGWHVTSMWNIERYYNLTRYMGAILALTIGLYVAMNMDRYPRDSFMYRLPYLLPALPFLGHIFALLERLFVVLISLYYYYISPVKSTYADLILAIEEKFGVLITVPERLTFVSWQLGVIMDDPVRLVSNDPTQHSHSRWIFDRYALEVLRQESGDGAYESALYTLTGHDSTTAHLEPMDELRQEIEQFVCKTYETELAKQVVEHPATRPALA